ncbi:nitrate reductase associated protein [Leptolyngbya ohadii]|uniref:nitrate reductase associated protein n=1 Tax=Leptolyngbya ohadii TaxID=1962290 RepID=UPI003F6FAB94
MLKSCVRFAFPSPPLPCKDGAILTAMQRFALIKLSRSQHENKNFLPALREFNLATV